MSSTAETEWYIYLVRTRGGTLYTGISTDVERRYEEHRAQGEKCARFLRGRAPLELVFQKKIGSRSLALKAERSLKKLPKRKKEQIIQSQPGTEALLSLLTLTAGDGIGRPARPA